MALRMRTPRFSQEYGTLVACCLATATMMSFLMAFTPTKGEGSQLAKGSREEARPAAWGFGKRGPSGFC